jgi:hypothetical protein
MSFVPKLSALILAAAACSAHASVITVQGARLPTSGPAVGAQPNAAAYRDTVTALLADTAKSLGTKSLASADNIAVSTLFGTTTNLAWMGTVDFSVGASQAGSWSFRIGGDFGDGAALFLDGVALASKSTDMWWAGSYSDATQILSGTASLAGGNHVLQLYGIEHCCNGNAQMQFKAANADGFKSFSATDNLNAVPEPASIAIFGLGLGVLTTLRARGRKQRG